MTEQECETAQVLQDAKDGKIPMAKAVTKGRQESKGKRWKTKTTVV